MLAHKLVYAYTKLLQFVVIVMSVLLIREFEIFAVARVFFFEKLLVFLLICFSNAFFDVLCLFRNVQAVFCAL